LGTGLSQLNSNDRGFAQGRSGSPTKNEKIMGARIDFAKQVKLLLYLLKMGKKGGGTKREIIKGRNTEKRKEEPI